MKNIKKDMEFKFGYSKEDDILMIYSPGFQTEETIEFSEYLNIDINKEGRIVGLEIFDALEFFSVINKQIDTSFLENLEFASLESKEFRNTWYLILILKSKNKQLIHQPMPLLQKSEYVSPLILSQK